jgi:formylglycine-generating enzyme required for sulfatase activity/pimeloyl-ACP methyl ester carboxylesterase
VSAPSVPSRAVFLSYASQDAQAARRIADALQAAGIEVWFDQSELRGGEAWDASIRRQIKICKLFLPVISASTQAREEGYFRREWNLAVARTLDMAEDTAYLLPVVIDSTSDADARVPERFRDVQWTRLPAGETPARFVDRVRGLTAGAGSAAEAIATHAVAPVAGIGAPHSGHSRAPAERRVRRLRAPPWWKPALVAVLLIGVGAVAVSSWRKKEQARNELLPAIQRRVETMFRSDRQLFDMAVEAEQRLPGDPLLAKLWPQIATTLSIETEPAGAEVFWKDYDTPAAGWRSAGITPLKDVKVPRDYLRLEIRKSGHQTIELAAPMFYSGVRPIVEHLKLDPVGSLPDNMVRIPKSTTDMEIVGLEKYGPQDVPEFLVDRFEVTNKQFKTFVDAGGYQNEAYWTVPIIDGNRAVPLKVALARFTDRTGRPGPATWEAGSYPDGLEDHPVTGVSWYEAAAFAAFVHKQLPTVFHWAAVADTARSEFLLPHSNFSGKSTSAVGSLGGVSTFGVYDLAGNAREWVDNVSGDSDQHFILGGGWTDPSYAFNDAFTQSALDRSESNGFRCIQELPGQPAPPALRRPTARDFRDYAKEQPVGDAAFAGFARQFVYDRTPLGATIESTAETDSWRTEVVSIDAGHNGERLVLHVYLPKNASAPLQPVVFFPGSNGIHESKYDPALVRSRLQFLITSGRAVIYPIYKGTYERQDDLSSDLQDETVRYKDHVIMWGKEYSRTIDYLETRKDMQADKVAFLGISWGGFMGGIIPAVEKRIKVVILNVGGMEMERARAEVDQLNYLPRVRQPTLMLNGAYDMFFPVETAQKPMFRLLGSAPEQKRMKVYQSGHLVPQTEFIKETLAWLDTYLGPVR